MPPRSAILPVLTPAAASSACPAGDALCPQEGHPGPSIGGGITFGTKLEIAAGAVTWLRSQLPGDAVPAWVVVDGDYAKREFLEPATKAGFVVVARLRKEAALCELPPTLPPGRKGSRGRPPTYGKNHLSLAKRSD